MAAVRGGGGRASSPLRFDVGGVSEAPPRAERSTRRRQPYHGHRPARRRRVEWAGSGPPPFRPSWMRATLRVDTPPKANLRGLDAVGKAFGRTVVGGGAVRDRRSSDAGSRRDVARRPAAARIREAPGGGLFAAAERSDCGRQ